MAYAGNTRNGEQVPNDAINPSQSTALHHHRREHDTAGSFRCYTAQLMRLLPLLGVSSFPSSFFHFLTPAIAVVFSSLPCCNTSGNSLESHRPGPFHD